MWDYFALDAKYSELYTLNFYLILLLVDSQQKLFIVEMNQMVNSEELPQQLISLLPMLNQDQVNQCASIMLDVETQPDSP